MSSSSASVVSGRAFDVVIAGAGIVGTAIAAEATQSGLNVAIVEPDQIGGGATAAGMGHLVVMDDSEAQFQLTRYSQMLWAELSNELPRQVEYDCCGTIWVALDDEEMGEVRRKHEYYSTRGVASEILDTNALRSQPCVQTFWADCGSQLMPPLSADRRRFS
jgi:glycine/D-amino acid oxidase-like deaminating enzyme